MSENDPDSKRRRLLKIAVFTAGLAAGGTVAAGASVASASEERDDSERDQSDMVEDQPEFDEIPNYIEDASEVNWLVQEAVKGKTPIPVISQSVMELFRSRGNQRCAYRAISLMRHGFGGHPFAEDEGIFEERVTSRVSNEARSDLAEDDARDPVRPEDRDTNSGDTL